MIIKVVLQILLAIEFVKGKNVNFIQRRQEFAVQMHYTSDVTLIKREYKECTKIPCSLDKHCTSALAKLSNQNCIGCHNGMCYDASKQKAKRKSFKKGTSSSSSSKKEEKQSMKDKVETSN